jgi:capsular polysaccharide biosynthesis protein
MEEKYTTSYETGTEIDLLELLKVIRDNLVLLIICTIFGMGLAYSYTKLAIAPTYRSVSTVYIKPSVDEGVVNYNELITNQKLTDTYTQIAKSNRVLDRVVGKLSAVVNVDDIRKAISVSSIKDTEIISISATTVDPGFSADVANTVVEVFIEQISSIMAIDNLRVIDQAIVEQTQVGPNTVLNTVIGGFLGLFAISAYVLIKKLLDRTIHGRNDAESLLNLPVLGEMMYYEDGIR